jgi:hypothetical protein
VHYNRRSPQGNRHMRRVLNQAANAAVKFKGSIFEILYRRYVPCLGHNQTIGVIAHKLCCLIWKILRHGVRYEERGPAVSKRSKQKRTVQNDPRTTALRYRVETLNPQNSRFNLTDFRPRHRRVLPGKRHPGRTPYAKGSVRAPQPRAYLPLERGSPRPHSYRKGGQDIRFHRNPRCTHFASVLRSEWTSY